ncbi:hypothetical protein N752_25080 [Desulforamulus aquiferis]|nr:hypothetical protein [Desulforamulus aquiferis]RYD02604.1 hypothetical protein N752_25080 [Desulforamulus aquiferis]
MQDIVFWRTIENNVKTVPELAKHFDVEPWFLHLYWEVRYDAGFDGQDNRKQKYVKIVL